MLIVIGQSTHIFPTAKSSRIFINLRGPQSEAGTICPACPFPPATPVFTHVDHA